MTDTYRYVDTSSAGGDGTTDALSGSNAAYTSLKACELAERGTVATGNRLIIYCNRGAAGADANTVNFLTSSWTVEDVKGLIIIANDTAWDRDWDGATIGGATKTCAHGGLRGVGYEITTNASAICLQVQEPGVVVSGIELAGTGTSSYGLRLSSGEVTHVERVLSRCGTGTNRYCFSFYGFSVAHELRNCIAGGGLNGFFPSSSTSNANIYNCGAFKCTTGFKSATGAGTTTLKNCVAIGCTNDYVDGGTGWGTGATNATDNASTSSPNITQNSVSTTEFTDYANDDFSLANIGSSKLVDQGTDLSGTFPADIVGVTRDATWDIGAHEYVSTGSTFNETISVTASGALAGSRSAALGASVSLATSGALASSRNAVLGTSVSLVTSGALASSRNAVLGASVSLVTQGALAGSRNAVLGASVSLGASSTMAPGRSLSTVEQISLAVQGALAGSRMLTMSEVAAMAASASVAETGNLTLMEQLALAVVASLASSSRAPNISMGVYGPGGASDGYYLEGSLGSDSAVGAISLWFDWHGPDSGSAQFPIFGSRNSGGGFVGWFGLEVTDEGRLFVYCRDSSGADLFSYQSSSAGVIEASAGRWQHIGLAWNNGTGTLIGYVDGVDVSMTVLGTHNAGNTMWSADYWGVLGLWQGGPVLSGDAPEACIAELWVAAEYVDFSDTATLQKFRSSGREQVDLGQDGSTPTGSQPLVYLSGGVSQFAYNFGSGGSFSEPAGSAIASNCTLDPLALSASISLPVTASLNTLGNLIANQSIAIAVTAVLPAVPTAELERSLALAAQAGVDTTAALTVTGTVTIASVADITGSRTLAALEVASLVAQVSMDLSVAGSVYGVQVALPIEALLAAYGASEGLTNSISLGAYISFAASARLRWEPASGVSVTWVERPAATGSWTLRPKDDTDWTER